MFENQKLQLLRAEAAKLDRSGADPRLVAVAQVLAASTANCDSANSIAVRHGNEVLQVTEESRLKSTGKSTGLARILAVRSGMQDCVIGRIVEKAMLQSDSASESGFWLNEALFYACHRNKFSISELVIPRLYGLEIGATHCRIFIEFLEGCRPAGSEAEFCKMATALGKFAGKSLHLRQANMEWLSYRSHRASLESLAQFEELVMALAHEMPVVRDGSEKFQQFVTEYDAIEKRRRHRSSCLCHGDAHARNLVMTKNATAAALLDWSHVRHGLAGDDLVFILRTLVMRPALWNGDLIAANKAILDAYCAGVSSIRPRANLNLIRRSYATSVILHFMAHSGTLLRHLSGARNEKARRVLTRRLARLLNRHAAAAQRLASVARNTGEALH